MVIMFNPMALLEFFLRWMHFFFAIMWIGHLYYFNMTQGTFLAMPDVDNSAKLSVRTKLLPIALWWFRWGALWTVVTGLCYWELKRHEFMSTGNYLESSYGWLITAGAIYGITMAYNVWFVIWPKQKIVIKSAEGVLKGQPALPEAAAAGARANVASRTNTLMSIPLLFLMGAASHLPVPVSGNTNYWFFWGPFLVIWAVVEFNAIKGQTYKFMTTVRQVTTSGFILSAIIIGLLYLAV
jgi:uncharacterized membrane protein